MGFHAGSFVQVATPSGVNFRSAPKVDPSNLITEIPNGAVMQVVGESVSDGAQSWTNVTWNGGAGFVAEQYMVASAAQQVPAGTLTVQGSGVNLRTDPSLGSKVIVQTGNVGDTVESAGVAINQFVAVAYKGDSGWMSASYLVPVGQASPLARTLPVQPNPIAPVQPNPLVPAPAVTPANVTTTKPPGGAVIAGGLLALALVIYFMAK